jgi:hypothetical protein
VRSDKVSHSLVSRFVSKANINSLLGVQVSVPVSSSSKGCWQGSTSCVDSLPHVGQIDATGNLFNENRSKSVLAELFVHAKEVDLSHFNDFAMRGHLYWDSRNKSKQFLLLSTTHTNDPVRVVVGRSESPF